MSLKESSNVPTIISESPKQSYSNLNCYNNPYEKWERNRREGNADAESGGSPFTVPPAVRSSSPVERRSLPADDEELNADVDAAASPTRSWSEAVARMCSTEDWLSEHGLRKKKLSEKQIFASLGFRHCKDVDGSLGRAVCPRYASGLFTRVVSTSGQVINLFPHRHHLERARDSLSSTSSLYAARMDWLTTESRRLFGVIEERSACLLVHSAALGGAAFGQFVLAAQRVLAEQVSRLKSFNLIRVDSGSSRMENCCVPVSGESLARAGRWLAGLASDTSSPPPPPISASLTCQALAEALADPQVEAVYLFTATSTKVSPLLYEKVSAATVPVHVVSFGCTSPEALSSLRRLAELGRGRFHAYAVTMHLDSVEASDGLVFTRRKVFGGIPEGAGCRPDVVRLFEEMEATRNTLAQVNELLADRELAASAKLSLELATENSPPDEPLDEASMNSKMWLARHGIKPAGLDVYDVLRPSVFRHADGVVDVLRAPEERLGQTDAVVVPKLIEAKYCDRLFTKIPWQDGGVVSVHVTEALCGDYEQQAGALIDKLNDRIRFLEQGSRQVFGTVVEENIYFLLDTSASMSAHLQFVMRKFDQLSHEQLRHKQQFNVVGFDSGTSPWRSGLTEVSAESLQSARGFVRSLRARGSTNTLAALRIALRDERTQAVYLLTDGRPDQSEAMILAEVESCGIRRTPVHCISFNCADRTANEFLLRIARATGGRFHYYRDVNAVEQPDVENAWQSEDLRLLRDELAALRANVARMLQLRDKCRAKNNSAGTSGKRVGSVDVAALTSLRRPRTANGRRMYRNRMPSTAKHTRTSELRGSANRDGDDDSPQQEENLHRKPKLTAYGSVKVKSSVWLKKFGLEALGLNPDDQLLSTKMPLRPTISGTGSARTRTYSKVFVGRFPVAKVAGSGSGRICYLNPDAVRPEALLLALAKAKKRFRRRLSIVAWAHVTPETRERFGNRKVSFVKNRDAMMESLRSISFGAIEEEDIVMLEEEIETADRYEKQFEAMIAERRKTAEDKEPQELKKAGRKWAAAERLRFQRMVARHPDDGFYYFAEFNSPSGRRHVDVTFGHESTSRRIRLEHVITVGGKTSSRLSVGHHVMCRVTSSRPGVDCFVPGSVTSLPLEYAEPPRYYAAELYNGQTDYFVRRHLLRIADARRRLICADLFGNLRASPPTDNRLADEHDRSGSAATKSILKKKMEEENELKSEEEDDKSNFKSEEEEEKSGTWVRRTSSPSATSDLSSSSNSSGFSIQLSLHSKSQTSHSKTHSVSEDEETSTTGETNDDGSVADHSSVADEWRYRMKSARRRQRAREGRRRVKKTAAPKEYYDVLRSPRPIHNSGDDNEPDIVLKMRRTGQSLPKGRNVVARWPDDGNYHCGKVLLDYGDYTYMIEESAPGRDVQRFWREDIVNLGQHLTSCRIGDTVLAPLGQAGGHTYSSAIVREVLSENAIVSLEQEGDVKLPFKQLLPLPAEKHQLDEEYRRLLREQLVGQLLVARDDANGDFVVAKVEAYDDTERKFKVRRSDDGRHIDTSDVFGQTTHHRSIVRGDCVLAPVDDFRYKPGVADDVRGETVRVVFSGHGRSVECDLFLCFWISCQLHDE